MRRPVNREAEASLRAAEEAWRTLAASRPESEVSRRPVAPAMIAASAGHLGGRGSGKRSGANPSPGRRVVGPGQDPLVSTTSPPLGVIRAREGLHLDGIREEPYRTVREEGVETAGVR